MQYILTLENGVRAKRREDNEMEKEKGLVIRRIKSSINRIWKISDSYKRGKIIKERKVLGTLTAM